MSLQELMNYCKYLDEVHDFPVTFTDQRQKYNQVTKDLVGLFGEIGEFSNIIKKINLKIEKNAIFSNLNKKYIRPPNF